MRDNGLNLNEDDGLSPWIRCVVKKYYILKQFKGAITAESYNKLTEDELEILEIVIQEMSSNDSSETTEQIFGG